MCSDPSLRLLTVDGSGMGTQAEAEAELATLVYSTAAVPARAAIPGDVPPALSQGVLTSGVGSSVNGGDRCSTTSLYTVSATCPRYP
jgi:hypothetical protein